MQSAHLTEIGDHEGRVHQKQRGQLYGRSVEVSHVSKERLSTCKHAQEKGVLLT